MSSKKGNNNIKDQKIEELEEEIADIIQKELEESKGLVGITVGTHGGTFLASKFKKDVFLRNDEITAANSSILFLSSKLLKGSLNQEISYDLIAGKERIVLSVLTQNVTMISYLNRELAELEGISIYIEKFKKLSLRISAIVDTSEVIKEEVFVAIKRAIPNALVIAIITQEGLPIKVQSTMAEPMLSAMISALYKLSGILLEKSELEYSIIGGNNGSIIIHELDNNRILCVAVPEADDSKLGGYIATIKTIIE
ncbi:MAG: hypothetical protein GF317_15115 [Candidatus Lokiarchaeota archaeon]|nr:hypothetical protein [Candidatus Lokiarchaeota archaeon]MBD3200906.1 hypothetical protein [Candidatus Lokiarchaeota archaeon]